MSDLFLSQSELDIDARLFELGFTIEWIRWGVLTLPQLEEIERDYQHELGIYREEMEAWQTLSEEEQEKNGVWPHQPDPAVRVHITLANWIENHSPLNDEQLARCLWLDRNSYDCRDLYMELIQSPWLTESQFDYLYRLCFARGQSRHAERERVLRRLRSEGLTESVREEILTHCPGPVQQTVLWREDALSDRSIVEEFAERGATKAVRNTARQMLKSHHFRDRP